MEEKHRYVCLVQANNHKHENKYMNNEIELFCTIKRNINSLVLLLQETHNKENFALEPWQ